MKSNILLRNIDFFHLSKFQFMKLIQNFENGIIIQATSTHVLRATMGATHMSRLSSYEVAKNRSDSLSVSLTEIRDLASRINNSAARFRSNLETIRSSDVFREMKMLLDSVKCGRGSVQ